MLDGADRVGAQPEAHGMAERVAEERGALQVRPEGPPGLVVGVADIVAGLYALAGDHAAPCHGRDPSNPRKIRALAGTGRPPSARGVLRERTGQRQGLRAGRAAGSRSSATIARAAA